ncbi:MAG: hypothetical protein II920_05775 [Clostridia bacterium]|nr:hypothetical protein [Clostridia bacterium]
MNPILNFFRKILVGIKRKPHKIPLIALGLAYIYYSLNLSSIAKTTTFINGAGMGIAEFVAMLFGVLLLVCFMNAFPHRKPVNIPMLVLAMAGIVLVFACDTFYRGRVIYALTREQNQIKETADIRAALTTLDVHRVILGIGVALTALLPVYTPLLRKINTNIRIEENGDMGKIDISGEDA